MREDDRADRVEGAPELRERADELLAVPGEAAVHDGYGIVHEQVAADPAGPDSVDAVRDSLTGRHPGAQ